MYKYLLFDADNTLLDFNRAEEAALRDTLNECPLGFSEEVHKRYHQINKEEWEKLERGETTRAILIVNRYRRLFNEYGYDGDYYGEFCAKAYESNLGNYGYLLDGAEETLRRASEKYSVYIITNGLTNVQKSRMSKTPLEKYIVKSYISEEMGCAKPEKIFFDKLCEDVGDNDTSAYLVIGDSLTSDIQGAVNAGMDSVWITDGTSDERPTYTVQNLSELCELLKV